MKNKDNKSTTLNAIIRVNILDAYDGNKFWIINNRKMLYKDGKQDNERLSDTEIVQGINDGTIKTDWAIKKKKILVNESEFFRIVKCLDPDNCILAENNYPFLKNIVEIKIGNSHKRYDPWFAVENSDDCGIIYVNGKRYKKIFCSSSHNRAKKVLCITEELYDRVMEINLCGIPKHDPNKVNFPCKWSAYEGMSCTDSQSVTMPNIVVIHDYNNPITEMFDVVTGKVVKNQYEISTDVKTEEREIKINAFDGAGLVGVELAKKWAKELGLDYVPSAFQFRAIPGIKGNLYPFDIKKFADTYHVQKIKDCWNKVWDLYNDKIDCIMTESQFKFAKMYNSFKEWKDAFDTDLYGYHRTFNISDYSIPYSKLQRHCIMAYQPLQTLSLTDEEIKALCADTVENVKKIHTDIDSFIKWRGLDGESETESGNDENDNNTKNNNLNYTNPVLKALQYNHSLATDPYVNNVILTELQRFRCLNHIKIRVDGNFQVLIPDIFGLAQWAFGIQPTGLLPAKQVYNKFWSNRHIKELDLIRFPHIAREHCLATVAGVSNEKWADMKQWYKYQDVGYVTSMWDSFALRIGGADFDNDHIYGVANKTLIEAVRRQEANTIYFDRDPNEASSNSKVTADDYCAMAKSDSIGFSNNIGTVVDNTSKLWSMITPGNPDNEKIMKYIKVMSTIDSLTIDFVKSGIKADMPQEIKNALKNYKNPYFFKYRTLSEYRNSIPKKSKSKIKIKEYNKNPSTMNRIAIYMDSQIANLKLHYNVPDFNWTTLLQGEYDFVRSTIYINIKNKMFKLQKEYESLCKQIDANESNQRKNVKKPEIFSQMRMFFTESKVDLLMIQPNINKLVNDIIIIYYTTSDFAGKKSKAILWQCFTSQMMKRVQNKKGKDKVYNIEELKKRHSKIEKAKEKQIRRILKNMAIDEIKVAVNITDMDKKYVNKNLNTQRSKKMYYGLLYIWLKINAEKENLIHIGYKKNKGEISVYQLCNLAGLKTRGWEDAITSLQKHNMVEVDEDNMIIKVIYERHEGKNILLPDTCKGMRAWINRYVPAKRSEQYEFVFDNSNAKIKGQYQNMRAVIRLEDQKIFASTKAADKTMGFAGNNVDAVCVGRSKTAGGYHWMFLDEYQDKYQKAE